MVNFLAYWHSICIGSTVCEVTLDGWERLEGFRFVLGGGGLEHGCGGGREVCLIFVFEGEGDELPFPFIIIFFFKGLE